VEQRRKKRSTSSVADTGGRLLLTEEEWVARMKAKDKGGSSGSGGSSGGGGRGCGCDKNKGRGGGRSGGANSSSQDGHEESVGCGACHNCDKMGHRARECWSKAKKGEAHMAQEEESSLLLMEAGVIKSASLSWHWRTRESSSQHPSHGTGERTVDSR
jgi:hypothetical protein